MPIGLVKPGSPVLPTVGHQGRLPSDTYPDVHPTKERLLTHIDANPLLLQ